MKTKNKIAALYAQHAHNEQRLLRALHRWEYTRAAINRLEKKADRELLRSASKSDPNDALPIG